MMGRKAVCVVSVVLMLLTALPLFGGAKKDEGSGVTTIRAWSDNAHEKSLRDVQIARFNAGRGKELGINIEYTVYGTNFSDAILIALQAGEAPELFRQDGKTFTDFVNAGLAVPLTELPGGQALVDQYKGELIPNLHTWDGKPYTLPYNVTTYKFIINRELFDAAGISAMPKTWDDVRECAKILTAKGNGQSFGFILGLKSPWTVTTYYLFPSGTNTGTGVFDNDKLQYNFSAHAPMVSAILGMINDGSVFPGYENLDADQMRAQFAAGRVGMIPGASFDVAVYNEQFPANFNWQVIDVPAFASSGSRYKEIVQATNLLAVSTTARKNPEKTMEVFKFFYSDENMAEMYEEGLYIPYRSQAVALAKKQPTAKGFAEFANVPQKLLLLPSPDSDVSVEGLVYREVYLRIFGKGYNESPAAVLKEVDDRYNNALKKLSPEKLNSFKAPSDRVITRQ
ncbi:MAG: extracellular solute-binding protein [Treponema sp.]|jgi:multiple sugar transport system substrate-binding protein|nr:extracellular solute-binding protein [Treponema sp.]